MRGLSRMDARPSRTSVAIRASSVASKRLFEAKTTPFSRVSLFVRGRSERWALPGVPSKLELEFGSLPRHLFNGGTMAKKTVFVSDLSGKEIEDGKAARINITFDDGRKGTYVLDVTEAEAMELGRKGRQQARRGRRPKAST
jgi:hypothetical protein